MVLKVCFALVICLLPGVTSWPSYRQEAPHFVNCIEADLSEIEVLKKQFGNKIDLEDWGNKINTSFGLLAEDWQRLELLQRRIPCGSVLRTKLVKVFRLLISALYLANMTSLGGRYNRDGVFVGEECDKSPESPSVTNKNSVNHAGQGCVCGPVEFEDKSITDHPASNSVHLTPETSGGEEVDNEPQESGQHESIVPFPTTNSSFEEPPVKKVPTRINASTNNVTNLHKPSTTESNLTFTISKGKITNVETESLPNFTVSESKVTTGSVAKVPLMSAFSSTKAASDDASSFYTTLSLYIPISFEGNRTVKDRNDEVVIKENYTTTILMDSTLSIEVSNSTHTPISSKNQTVNKYNYTTDTAANSALDISVSSHTPTDITSKTNIYSYLTTVTVPITPFTKADVLEITAGKFCTESSTLNINDTDFAVKSTLNEDDVFSSNTESVKTETDSSDNSVKHKSTTERDISDLSDYPDYSTNTLVPPLSKDSSYDIIPREDDNVTDTSKGINDITSAVTSVLLVQSPSNTVLNNEDGVTNDVPLIMNTLQDTNPAIIKSTNVMQTSSEKPVHGEKANERKKYISGVSEYDTLHANLATSESVFTMPTVPVNTNKSTIDVGKEMLSKKLSESESVTEGADGLDRVSTVSSDIIPPLLSSTRPTEEYKNKSPPEGMVAAVSDKDYVDGNPVITSKGINDATSAVTSISFVPSPSNTDLDNEDGVTNDVPLIMNTIKDTNPATIKSNNVIQTSSENTTHREEANERENDILGVSEYDTLNTKLATSESVFKISTIPVNTKKSTTDEGKDMLFKELSESESVTEGAEGLDRVSTVSSDIVLPLHSSTRLAEEYKEKSPPEVMVAAGSDIDYVVGNPVITSKGINNITAAVTSVSFVQSPSNTYLDNEDGVTNDVPLIMNTIKDTNPATIKSTNSIQTSSENTTHGEEANERENDILGVSEYDTLHTNLATSECVFTISTIPINTKKSTTDEGKDMLFKELSESESVTEGAEGLDRVSTVSSDIVLPLHSSTRLAEEYKEKSPPEVMVAAGSDIDYVVGNPVITSKGINNITAAVTSVSFVQSPSNTYLDNEDGVTNDVPLIMNTIKDTNPATIKSTNSIQTSSENTTHGEQENVRENDILGVSEYDTLHTNKATSESVFTISTIPINTKKSTTDEGKDMLFKELSESESVTEGAEGLDRVSTVSSDIILTTEDVLSLLSSTHLAEEYKEKSPPEVMVAAGSDIDYVVGNPVITSKGINNTSPAGTFVSFVQSIANTDLDNEDGVTNDAPLTMNTIKDTNPATIKSTNVMFSLTDPDQSTFEKGNNEKPHPKDIQEADETAMTEKSLNPSSSLFPSMDETSTTYNTLEFDTTEFAGSENLSKGVLFSKDIEADAVPPTRFLSTSNVAETTYEPSSESSYTEEMSSKTDVTESYDQAITTNSVAQTIFKYRSTNDYLSNSDSRVISNISNSKASSLNIEETIIKETTPKSTTFDDGHNVTETASPIQRRKDQNPDGFPCKEESPTTTIKPTETFKEFTVMFPKQKTFKPHTLKKLKIFPKTETMFNMIRPKITTSCRDGHDCVRVHNFEYWYSRGPRPGKSPLPVASSNLGRSANQDGFDPELMDGDSESDKWWYKRTSLNRKSMKR